jgi:hypothetical protein
MVGSAVAAKYRKHDVVRVAESYLDPGVRGLEGAVVDDSLRDDKRGVGYSIWVYDLDELWFFREDDLEPTSRVERRGDLPHAAVPRRQIDLGTGEGAPS